ncbi:MAG: hypothetical protein F4Y32_03355 [Holophagales bacterium]|nr:hypothetical protein [Holophagales bacterium]
MTVAQATVDVERVRKLVEEELESRLGSEFKFGPVRVLEMRNVDDEPYLRVQILVHGDTSKPRLRKLAKGTIGLRASIEQKMAEQGAELGMLLLPSYLKRAEWHAEASA